MVKLMQKSRNKPKGASGVIVISGLQEGRKYHFGSRGFLD
jgi:hypothetical protein